MNAKQMKKARRLALEKASEKNLAAIGAKAIYAKWWRKLVARIFPKIRAQYEAAIARWEKATVKRWAHFIGNSHHDPYIAALAEARRKAARKRRLERAKKDDQHN